MFLSMTRLILLIEQTDYSPGAIVNAVLRQKTYFGAQDTVFDVVRRIVRLPADSFVTAKIKHNPTLNPASL